MSPKNNLYLHKYSLKLRTLNLGLSSENNFYGLFISPFVCCLPIAELFRVLLNSFYSINTSQIGRICLGTPFRPYLIFMGLFSVLHICKDRVKYFSCYPIVYVCMSGTIIHFHLIVSHTGPFIMMKLHIIITIVTHRTLTIPVGVRLRIANQLDSRVFWSLTLEKPYQ